MKCSKRALNSYIDGELSSSEKADIEKHLSGCLLCRDALEKMTYIKDTLLNIPVSETDPPDSLWRRVASSVPEKRSRRIPLFGYGVTAGALLLLFSVFINRPVYETGNAGVEYAALKIQEIYGDIEYFSEEGAEPSFIELVLLGNY